MKVQQLDGRERSSFLVNHTAGLERIKLDSEVVPAFIAPTTRMSGTFRCTTSRSPSLPFDEPSRSKQHRSKSSKSVREGLRVEGRERGALACRRRPLSILLMLQLNDPSPPVTRALSCLVSGQLSVDGLVVRESLLRRREIEHHSRAGRPSAKG